LNTQTLFNQPCATAWAAALACATPFLHAQDNTAPSATQTIVVTGNPLGRERGATPASVLSGEALLLKRSGTLGDTLDGLPGVAGTGFGPNASRPVIRGLDGDRIRVLDNGGATVDASSLSFDHAVAFDPLVAERIEVLRGPAALLYGGSATGGVVNTIDNRVPRVLSQGLSGRAEVRLGGAANERSGALVLDGGTGSGLAWHADAFGRRNGDQRAPLFTPLEDGVALDPSRRVRNSAARAEGGAVGGGFIGRDGFAGLSFDTYRNDYGVTVEPDVLIRMKRDRLAAAGEWRRIGGSDNAVAVQGSRTDYRHEEVEGSGEVGTTFDSTGQDLRAELRHARWGPLLGVVGVQAETLRFSALGEEAFVPGTRTRSNALFLLEELAVGPWVFAAGARAEQVRVASDGGGERFGDPLERRFTPKSASLQARAELGGGWSAQLNAGRTERAPTYYELYANGVHVATGAYERGDATLPSERSRHVEGGVAWTAGVSSASLNVFRTDFARYIALDATGDEIEEVPEYAFSAVRARVSGVEAEWKTSLPTSGGARVFGLAAIDLHAGLDAVRGENLDTGEPLPRQPPLRLRGGITARFAAVALTLNVQHAAKQDRVPATDGPTAGYTRVDLLASGTFGLAGRGARWFIAGRNLGNTGAYNAVTVSTIRGLSPMAGRSIGGGVQWRF